MSDPVAEYQRSILKAALKYQKRGLEIVPTTYVREDDFCSCSKGAKCASPGKHPAVAGWTKDYTSKDKTLDQIFRMGQGVGIKTGTVNKLIVVDCDTRESYEQVLQSFAIPTTRTVKTHRGYQIYLKIPADLYLKGSQNILKSMDIFDVDLRAEKNFVMAPPSKHPKGGRYEWFIKGKVADVPELLVEALEQQETKGSKTTSKRVSSGFSGKPVQVGERYETFKDLAVRCRNMGLDKYELQDLLLSTPYDNPVDDLFTEDNILELAEWAYRDVEVREGSREVLITLLSIYRHYSEMRWKGVGGGTDHDVVMSLIDQGLSLGKMGDSGIDVPMARRTLATKAGITTKTVEASLKRLKRHRVVIEGQKVEGSRSGSIRLLYIAPTETANYAEVTQINSACIGTPYTEPYNCSSVLPLHKFLHQCLSESSDNRWGKDRLGKVNATRLSILLAHSKDTSTKIYKNREVAEVLSAHTGKEIKSPSLTRFFERCSEAGALTKIKHGLWEIPDEVYENIESYREETGENRTADEQATKYEEEREVHREKWRLRRKLDGVGLSHAFRYLGLKYLLLDEDGHYRGECPDKMREFLTRSLADGEYVGEEVEEIWPSPEGNNEDFKRERRIKAFLNDEITYADLQIIERLDVRVLKSSHPKSMRGYCYFY